MGAPDESTSLLGRGEAFVDLSDRRTIAVSGSQALRWLNDIVSAQLGDLEPIRARRSLLLSPTGAVLAEFTVARVEGTIVLIQDPGQPRSIEHLLEPYVLSSDVRLENRTGAHAIFGFPGRTEPPDAPNGTTWYTPSTLGAGLDLVAGADDHDTLEAALSETSRLATRDETEAWRITSAIPRVGVDTADGDLPQEVRLDEAVSFDKGCFLGQEAVAKMRNLGHPRRWLALLETEGEVSSGDALSAGTNEVGVVTSVARVSGTSFVLARVRWGHRDAPLRTASGVELRPRVPLREAERLEPPTR